MSGELEYASVQRFASPQGGREHYLRHGSVLEEREVPIPETHLRFAATGGARLYEAVRRTVRVLVRALYFSPIVILPKIVLFAVESWYSDLITLAFVLLVVVLFAAVSVLVLLHLMVGPRSLRRQRSRIVFDPPRGIPVLPERTGDWLSVTGRIDAGVGALDGEVVVHERWDEAPEGMRRTLWSKRFAVVSDDQPPIILDLEASPTILGPYVPDPLEMKPDEFKKAMNALGLAALDPGAPSCTLRHGDRVGMAVRERVAISDVNEMPFGGRKLRIGSSEGGPYRGSEAVPGLHAKSTLEAPIVLRRVE